jgi:hypothetical protein
MAVLGGVLLVQTVARAQRPGGIDLTSYLLSARTLLHGGSPYLLPTPFPYLYPATLAFLLIPLTLAAPIVAVVVWFAIGAAAVCWATRTVLLAARPDRLAPGAAGPVFLAIFFTFFFTVLQSNLRNGQVNFLVLALCVAAALRSPSPQSAIRDPQLPDPHDLPAPASPPALPAHPALPALSWSLAVAVKLVPLALLPYFLLRRSWGWLVGSALLIAGWCALPVLLVGPRIADIYEQYWRVLLAVSFAPQVQPLDFSLAGTIAWATRSALTPALRLSAAAVVFGWILQVDARRLRMRDTQPFALYMLAIPLVSPQSEVHHLAFMLPAATVVGVRWWWGGHAGTAAFRVAMAAAAVLYLGATVTPVASGPLFCASLLALGGALVHAERLDAGSVARRRS